MDKDMDVINSLSDYINFINKYPSSDFVFRGENDFFDNRIAAVFRENDGLIKDATSIEDLMSKMDSRVYVSYEGLLEKYYFSVSHMLSDIDKNHFVAFARHHGLPTNLLDITDNPLVALFMACDGVQKDKLGYVYIFDRDYIDITDILNVFPKDNIIELLISLNPKMIQVTYKMMINYASNHSDTFKKHLYHTVSGVLTKYANPNYLDKIIKQDVFEDMDNIALLNYLNEIIEVLSNREDYDCFKNMAEVIRENCIPAHVNITTELTCIYMIFLPSLLDDIARTLPLQAAVACIPKMIYKPKNTVERARMQYGYFIYQPYRIFYREGKAAGIYRLQEENHVKKIKINKGNSILKELDNVGMNCGTLYGDFDNFAKYIKEKHWDVAR